MSWPSPLLHWLARARAWPGLLTVLSVLAVAVGSQPTLPESGPRWAAAPQAPALPELRPAPQPTPPSASLPPPALPPLRTLRAAQPAPAWSLRRGGTRPHAGRLMWGRQQTDGG